MFLIGEEGTVFHAARLKGCLARRFFCIHRQENEACGETRCTSAVLYVAFLTTACWRCFNDPFLWTMLGVSSIRTGHSLASALVRRDCRGVPAASKAFIRSELALAAFFKMSYRCEQNRNTSLALEIYEIAQCLLRLVLFAKNCSSCNNSWASLTSGIVPLSSWGIIARICNSYLPNTRLIL